uniref:Uncharacterized protein n=1 Tax=Avena sativa TaxID=4498 RepID=A0ACD5X401_AVESA
MDQLHNMTRMSAHEAALRAVQKPPSKPWRGPPGLGAPAPTPPKVYRVEPREFRDLVQRLTGAPAAVPAPAQARQHHQHVAVAQPVPVRPGGGEMYASSAAAPWCSFPLMAPAQGMHPGLDGQHFL